MESMEEIKNYPFYVKEMEFRFNHRNENVYKLLSILYNTGLFGLW